MNELNRSRSHAPRLVLPRAAITAIVLAIATAGCAARQTVATRDDVTITSDVRARLAADAQVSALKITVDTKDGVVHLSGSVAKDDERSSIERIARETPGVRTVDNDVRFGATAAPIVPIPN